MDDRVALVRSNLGLTLVEIDVMEEGARASTYQGIGEFVSTNGRDNIANTLGAKISYVVGINVFFDGVIERTQHLAWAERKSNRNNEKTILSNSVENAFAVGETKVGFREGHKGASDGVISLGLEKGVRNILAIGTDVLDGGTTSKTRDFTHGLDAGKAFTRRVFNDIVPVFATHDFDFAILLRDATHAVNDDNTVEAIVVTEGVGAISENESRELGLSSEIISFGDFSRGFDFNDITSWATEAHGSKAGY